MHIRRLLSSLLVGALAAFAVAVPALAADQGVGVADDVFIPARVAVKPGESVTWTKPSTAAPHNLRFEDEPSARPGPVTFDPWTTARTFGAAGSYRYYCEVHGGPGGLGMSGVVYVNAPGSLPPVAAFLVSANPAQVAQSVSFDGSGSSATGPATVAKYEWDLDGNGSFETDTLTTPTTSRAYTTPGTVTVRLRVSDSNGLTEETTMTRPLRINAPPSASFTASPSPALTGQTVSFNGASSGDSDGTIAKYEWDLDGNGSFETDTGTTPTTSRSYAGPGPVTVKLRVTDNNGAPADTTRPLQITARPQITFPPPLQRPITPTQPITQPEGVAQKRKAGKCSKLKGKRRTACIRRSCGRLKGKKKRACVKKVTLRR